MGKKRLEPLMVAETTETAPDLAAVVVIVYSVEAV